MRRARSVLVLGTTSSRASDDRVYSYETRNKADLYLHSVNTIFGQRCIKFKGALIWNDLPDHIEDIHSINKLKSKLKIVSPTKLYSGITVSPISIVQQYI